METTRAKDRRGRSKVTNGKALHVEPVHPKNQNKWSRRFADIVYELTKDHGGTDALDETQRSVIRRIATMTILAERMEIRIANGEDVPADEYGTLCDRLNRAYARLELRATTPREPATEVIDGVTYVDGKPDLTKLTDDEFALVETVSLAHLPEGRAPGRPATYKPDPMARLTHPAPSSPPPTAHVEVTKDEDIAALIDRVFR